MRSVSPNKKFALILALFAGSTILIVPSPSMAQYAQLFRDAAMSPEDIEMAQDTAASLYTNPGVKVGEQAKWQNPESGAEGLVEILKVDNQGLCVTFRHLAATRTKSQVRYTIRRCKDAGGDWLLSAD